MLHKLIDDLPEDTLPKAADIFEKMIEKEVISDKEIEELNIIRKEIENGEPYSLMNCLGNWRSNV
ncbi:hypothetical protein [Oceanobacillus sp. CFH 90083]|uniref:hypothetical protein n=1 Tax=Oceanobacillus sp. CFH 90083 TaxID=2592336 RepID=UPI00128CB2AE|nr:hypothetical protein [Oceanobacillus sp. CFH 90083]